MSARADLAEQIGASMVAALSQGVVPWVRPWSVDGLEPVNAVTGHRYRGVNAVILPMVQAGQGYTSCRWLTFKQAQAAGGRVLKGSKGTHVVFWKVLEKDAEAGRDRDVPMMRTFTVFNLDQVSGCELPAVAATPVLDTGEVADGCAAILAGYVGGPEVIHSAQGKAFYSPLADRVTLPPVMSFHSVAGYVGTLCHELTHSTGHTSRLARFTAATPPARFGDPVYALEELIAEIGSVTVATAAGLPVEVDQSTAYVAGWLEALQGDPGMVMRAAQSAQKAADLILGTQYTAPAVDQLEEVVPV